MGKYTLGDAAKKHKHLQKMLRRHGMMPEMLPLLKAVGEFPLTAMARVVNQAEVAKAAVEAEKAVAVCGTTSRKGAT